MKKVSQVLLWIFAGGVLLTVLAGGLTLVGYAVALCIGGETAEQICVFLFKTCFPWLIRICSISVGFGLIGMYLQKKKALTAVTEEKKETT